MNEMFSALQSWFNSLPEAQANFLTSGFMIMLVVAFVLKFLLKGVIKWVAMIILGVISYFWLTGHEIPILSEYFTV